MENRPEKPVMHHALLQNSPLLKFDERKQLNNNLSNKTSFEFERKLLGFNPCSSNKSLTSNNKINNEVNKLNNTQTTKGTLTPQHKTSKRSSSETHLAPKDLKETSKDPLTKLSIGSFMMDIKKTQVSKQKSNNAFINSSTQNLQEIIL